jgi:antitoxin VapB
MGIFIKKPEAEAKIRELAALTGETLTDAIEKAVDDRLANIAPQPRKGRVDHKKLAEVLAYFDSLPKTNEHLTDDEIVGYDDSGVPK